MVSISLTRRDWILVVVLLSLFLGAAYYLGFHAPLQAELGSIEAQNDALDDQLEAVAARVARMEAMRAELDAILTQSNGDISEIAPYDNKEAVLHQLNLILGKSEEYRLTFLEPAIGSDGMVRRSVVMDFTCADFAAAQEIIEQLSGSRWRCLVSNLSVSGTPDVMSGPVQVSATVTFFESTKLHTSRP